LRFAERLFRDKVNGALDAWIDHEGVAGVVPDGANNRLNLSTDKVKRRLFLTRLLCLNAECAEHGAQQDALDDIFHFMCLLCFTLVCGQSVVQGFIEIQVR